MEIDWERYVAAMDLLIKTERSPDAIAEVKQLVEVALEDNPNIRIFYGLMAKGRQGVSACQKPAEGVTEEWLKEFMVRCSTYNHATGALAVLLALCPEVTFSEPPSVPNRLPRTGVRKRRFKSRNHESG